MHAWFTLPAGDLKTLFLLSRDRHASGIVYFVESAGDADVEVEVQAFYRSEGALQERTICALRRGQGEHGIGVFVSLRARFHLHVQLRMTRVSFAVCRQPRHTSPRRTRTTSLSLSRSSFGYLSRVRKLTWSSCHGWKRISHSFNM